MKARNRITSTLLALLLSLSMVVTYLPASMIAYATDENVVEQSDAADADPVDSAESRRWRSISRILI